MKVILLKDVHHLGKAGDAAQVKNGYFRNYLLPRKLAASETAGGIRFLEAKKKQALERLQQEKETAVAIAKSLEKITCTIEAKVGQEGKLFGAVTNRDVEEALKKHGFHIERKNIELQPIHAVGHYQASIYLHPEINVSLNVTITAQAAKK